MLCFRFHFFFFKFEWTWNRTECVSWQMEIFFFSLLCCYWKWAPVCEYREEKKNRKRTYVGQFDKKNTQKKKQNKKIEMYKNYRCLLCVGISMRICLFSLLWAQLEPNKTVLFFFYFFHLSLVLSLCQIEVNWPNTYWFMAHDKRNKSQIG